MCDGFARRSRFIQQIEGIGGSARVFIEDVRFERGGLFTAGHIYTHDDQNLHILLSQEAGRRRCA